MVCSWPCNKVGTSHKLIIVQVLIITVLTPEKIHDSNSQATIE